MKLTTHKGFRPLSINIETEEELRELVGVLYRVRGSAMIGNLHDKLSNELGIPTAELFEGFVTRRA